MPCDSTVIVASDDFYILGILTSKIHRIWVEAQSSTLGETIRYTHNSCFETFPFPTPPTPLDKGGDEVEGFSPNLGDNQESKKVLNIRDLGAEIAPLPPSLGDNQESKKAPNVGDLGAEKIRQKMLELHEYRTSQIERKNWGITQFYNSFFHEPSSKLYQLHQQLDKLVMKAYNFDENEDLLTQLLALNLQLSES